VEAIAEVRRRRTYAVGPESRAVERLEGVVTGPSVYRPRIGDYPAHRPVDVDSHFRHEHPAVAYRAQSRANWPAADDTSRDDLNHGRGQITT
jgi:hypothetical protein